MNDGEERLLLKIGIITYHRANNYGAVLQAYALSTFLNSQGHQCEIIDYRSDYLEKGYKVLPSIRDVPFKNALLEIVNTPFRTVKKVKFDCFREKYLAISEKYNSTNIGRSSPLYDIFIFGSDQIWNCFLNGNDYNYFGKFVVDSSKLNAFAASFGDNYFLRDETAWSYLSKFNHVSIREKSGVELFHKYANDKAVEVLDPVFLLTKGDWERLLKLTRQYKEDYIFIYHLKGKQTKVTEYAMKLSKETGLRVINGAAIIKNNPKEISSRYCLSPIEFLDYLRNAKYIITDSFHCASFAIIFRKQFAARIGDVDEIPNCRVGNLLKKFGLEKQIITCKPSFFEIFPETVYDEAEINMLIEEARAFLRSICF